MKRKRCLGFVFTLLLCAGATGCYHFRHTVGDGGGRTSVQVERQWYALWGLIPLDRVDGGELAGSASDYTIETELGPVDIVLNLITAWVSITSRSVKVYR
jgi:hypothetical protein